MNKRLWGPCFVVGDQHLGEPLCVSKYVMDFVPPFTLLGCDIIAGLVLGILMVLFANIKLNDAI